MNLELRGNKWITDTTSLCTCSLNCIKVWGVAPYVALLFQEFPLKFPHILSTLILSTVTLSCQGSAFLLLELGN